MRTSSNPDIVVEPCPDRPKKRRHLGCNLTDKSPPPLAFASSNVSIGDTVCYGMIDGLPVLNRRNSTVPQPREPVAVSLHNDKTLRRQSDGEKIRALDEQVLEVLTNLAQECIEFQISYAVRTDGAAAKTRSKGLLEIILYGPSNKADSIGIFMEECGYCLQDPYDCDRNVPYINPHRLSSMFDDPPMTQSIQPPKLAAIEKFTSAAFDALANYQTSEQLALASTPSALSTQLQLHQRQALSFFQRREMGLGTSNQDCGIWQARTSSVNNAQIFVNLVTDEEQPSMPPVWRGGILADEMGLGKTLSMIALIASDKQTSQECASTSIHTIDFSTNHSTLIIVPQNVLSGWEVQLKRHVHAGCLTWIKHQGKSRIRTGSDTKLPDIVFTTYQTVESEYRREKITPGPLSSTKWKRIVLDEAHIVRNWKSSTAKAIAALPARSHWAISATPIQNGLHDLLGLFRFLQFHPYEDPKVFDDEIAGLVRKRSLDESIERLIRLMSCIMIRRTKANVAISLPPRREEVVRLRFTAQEKVHYESIEQTTAAILDEGTDEFDSSTSRWTTALQQIHSLRVVCNLGIYSTLAPSGPGLSTFSIDEDDSILLMNARLMMGDPACHHCSMIFDVPQASSHFEDNFFEPAYYSNCYKFFCATCATILKFNAPKPCDCDAQNTICTLQSIPLQQLAPALSPMRKLISPGPELQSPPYISTKIRALMADISSHLEKKSVVFSFWTSTLDMVEKAMKYADIKYARIDGKVPQAIRSQTLEQYRQDLNIKVLLITTSCGALGIDLTVATRAYMLEPQWNPTVEEQAMARIHRIGQTQPVTTLRYIMEDSIEEHIKDVVQDRKKTLISLLLPSHKKQK